LLALKVKTTMPVLASVTLYKHSVYLGLRYFLWIRVLGVILNQQLLYQIKKEFFLLFESEDNKALF